LASVYLREGAIVWKALNFKQSDIIVHVYDKPDSLAKVWVLGPNVTAEGLLEQLTNPRETFYSVLKDDKVLIGILLGFGPQNAIHVSRLENLEEMLYSAETPPFKSRLL